MRGCLGAEDESEAEGRGRCEQDAGQVGGAKLAHAESFERGVAAVTRQPNCRGIEESTKPGNEDHVPRRRRAPVEPRAPVRHLHGAPAAERLATEEEVGGSTALVLEVHPIGPPRTG